jgi:DNA processing protein
VAIVGTRQATRPARRFACRLAVELSSAGVAILSGGALGIDTEAHLGALRAGGPTVVVAPAGFERPYPPENALLFQSILQAGGAYLSARAPTEAADFGAFFRRNAVLAALAHAVVVVEAPVRSGARNAAQHARQLGRPLLVVPAAPWNVRGRGCIVELRLGARVLASFRDVLGALAEQRLHPIPLGKATEQPLLVRRRRRETVRPSLPRAVVPYGDADDARELRAVMAAVRAGATGTDELAVSLGMPARAVQRSVLMLTLRGEVMMDATGQIRLVERR